MPPRRRGPRPAPRTSSPSISKSGSTSAASAAARARALGSPAVARRADHAAGCSTSSIAPASAPRSSSSAGSPSAIPRLVGEIRAAGHDIGSHGYVTSARLRARRRRVSSPTSRQSVAALRAAGVAARRRRSARRSGRSTTGRSGRSNCWRAKGSRSTPAWRRCSIVGRRRLPAASARAARPPPGRSSRCRRSSPIGSGR